MKLILTICMALALAGCAHKEYYEAIKEVAKYEQIAASGPATALAAGAASMDPQVAVAAVTSAGIAEALRLSGRGGQASAIDRIAPPPSALDYVKTFGGLLVDGGRVWAGVRAIDKSAEVAIKTIDGNVQTQKIQSEERLGTIGKIVDIAKEPRNVTNVNASGSGPVAVNGSSANNNESSRVECITNQSSRAGDSSNSQTAGTGGTGTGTTGTVTAGQGGPANGGDRSAPAATTANQGCTSRTGGK